MQSRPILPVRLAKESLEEIKSFVWALLYSRDVETREAVNKCLFEEDPMVKGPFVHLRLPYVSSESKDWPLNEILNPQNEPEPNKRYLAFAHQMKAFSRLQSQDAKPTLVTTGTGSGKSECFQLPILDYVIDCKQRSKGEGGVKALVIYPMNALIDDQAARFAKLAHKIKSELNINIRVGRYTGAGGNSIEMSESSVIDSREDLVKNPPDILLTNYRMLDLMLMRPEEQKFWSDPTPEVFKYLVIDELHSFDGAQGADVAVLLRRLKLKLKKNESIICVGTSATLAGEKGKEELCDFASKLFGESFSEESIIGEQQVQLHEYLLPIEHRQIPSDSTPMPATADDGVAIYDRYLKSLFSSWQTPHDPEELGQWLLRHALTHKLLPFFDAKVSNTRAKKYWQVGELVEQLKDERVTEDILTEYFDLLAYARKQGGFPLFSQQAQLWVQEAKWLLRRLSKEEHFLRPHQYEASKHEGLYLPAVHCRECGASGWLTILEATGVGGDRWGIIKDWERIRAAYFSNEAQIIFPRDQAPEAQSAFVFDPSCHQIVRGSVENEASFSVVVAPQKLSSFTIPRRYNQKQPQDLPSRCPQCDSPLALRMNVASSSMLTSALAGNFLSSPANPTDSERKLLIFNDSVQDAAHQAGYVSARGFRFKLRRFIQKSIYENQSDGQNLNLIESQLKAKFSEWIETASNQEDSVDLRQARKRLFQILPQDLWERWKAITGSKNPLLQPSLHEEFIERLLWEARMEFSLFSGLGWSLRKTGLCHVGLRSDLREAWAREARQILIQLNGQSDINQESVLDFIDGLSNRLLSAGCLFDEKLVSVWEAEKMSPWRFFNSHPYLQPVVQMSFPKVLSISNDDQTRNAQRLMERPIAKKRTTRNWYRESLLKHGLLSDTVWSGELGSESDNFYALFFQRLNEKGLGVVATRGMKAFARFALSSEAFVVSQSEAELRRCDSCGFMDLVLREKKSAKCIQWKCNGSLQQWSPEIDLLKQKADFVDYMSRHYQKDLVSPMSHVHVGQLDANDRQKVEAAFKNDLLPGDRLSKAKVYDDHPINMLSCTPTLEMGIDIGSLSGVFIKSFPRDLAAFIQRIGRAGRKSGNAFNAVIAKTSPHDTYFWDHPEEVLEGQVRSPGCEYRNEQVLLRHWNAYLIDEFARTHPNLQLPSYKDVEEGKSYESEFWQGFSNFVAKKAGEYVGPFVDLIFAAKTEGENFRRVIQSQIENLEPWLSIKSILQEEDRRAHLQKEVIEAGEKRKSKSIFDQYEYLFSSLASEGVLPNYAFPPKGVKFKYAIRSKGRSDDDQHVFLNKEIERAPVMALRDLAPNATYYADGFKIPVKRIDLDKSKMGFIALCHHCGSADLRKEKGEDLCRFCESTGAIVQRYLTYKSCSGTLNFADAQIRDQDEERDRPHDKIGFYVSFKPGKKKHHSTWISAQQGMGFEFLINAQLSFVNEGESKGDDETEAHRICQECGAVAIKQFNERTQQISWSFWENGKLNRHRQSCSFEKRGEGQEEAEPFVFGYQFESDVIRIPVRLTRELPTLKAVMGLALKIFLKGNPGHLRMTTERIYEAGDNKTYHDMLVIYDDVPKGSGHLKSLLNYQAERTSKIIEPMKRVFIETLSHLSACKCELGCYQCLYSKDNAFEQSEISKHDAKNWLKRFIDANDWAETKDRLIDRELGTSMFDGKAEEALWSALLALEDSSLKSLLGIQRVYERNSTDGRLLEIVGRDGEKIVIQNTPYDSVRLKYRATKPDFQIFKPGKGCVGYIYADGETYHCHDAETFERDVSLRKELRDQEKLPVYSISTSMIRYFHKLLQEPMIYERSFKKLQNIERQSNVSPWLMLLLASMMKRLDGLPKDKFLSFDDLMPLVVAQMIKELLDFQPFEPKNKRIWGDEQLAALGSIASPSWGGFHYDSETKGLYFLVRSDNFDSDYKASWNYFWALWIKGLEIELTSKTKGNHRYG